MPAVNASGKAQPIHEFLRHHARLTPGKPAIIWYGREISYAELDRLSDACAAVLAGMGVKRGEPVALYMQNCPQYVIAHAGIQKLGAIVAPCSPLFKSVELAYQLGDLGCRVIVAADNLYPVVESVKAEARLEHVLLVHYQDMLPSSPSYGVPQEIRYARSLPAGCADFLALLESQTTFLPPTEFGLDEVALLIYTSGTTGRPKGAMLTFRNALFKTEAGVNIIGLRSDDVHLAIAPLYHIAGMLCGLNIPLYCGATVVLHYRFDAVAALESIERHKVTYWKGVGPMLLAMMDAPGAGNYDLASLRLTSAPGYGIRMTEEFSKRWEHFTGGCAAHEVAYGLSETHTFDAVMPPNAVRWGTLGKLSPGVRCRIVEPGTAKELRSGEQGEITLQSPGNFLGYWRNPEKTAEALREGWLYFGDIGTLDADGYLTLLGRTKELIKVSGYSVFPEDVEAILLTHPQIEQVAILGMPDPAKGEIIKAVVVLKAEDVGKVAEQEIIAWSRKNMSAYKVPRKVEFRSDLPKAPSGKVLRKAL